VRPPARKRWGQNFLIDPNMIDKLVRTIGPKQDDHFLEIGPGHGELTLPLAAQVAAVTAVDIDPWLVEDLKAVAPDNVRIIEADILDVDLFALLGKQSRVYGSLPYYITSKILFRLVDERKRWSDAHVIVQKEVGERMAAEPGTKLYGRLSVMLQAYLDVETCHELPPTVFKPQPDVASVMVRLKPSGNEKLIESTKLFATVVRLAFGQRRKKLANALKSLDMGPILSEQGVAELRAERLSVGQFITIANQLNLLKQNQS